MASNIDRGDVDTEGKNGTFSPKRRVHKNVDHSAEYDPSEIEGALRNIEPAQVIGEVCTFARANPHIALAGAAAVGFILGGGLTPRLVGAVGMLAARRYLQGSMKETLESLIKSV